MSDNLKEISDLFDQGHGTSKDKEPDHSDIGALFDDGVKNHDAPIQQAEALPDPSVMDQIKGSLGDAAHTLGNTAMSVGEGAVTPGVLSVLAGATGAAGETLAGRVHNLDDLKQNYSDYKNNALNTYKKADDENPILSKVGKGTGFLTSLFGTGSLLKGAGAATKGAGALSKAVSSAKTALPIGAGIGLANSPNNLINSSNDEKIAAIKDAAKSGVLASVIGSGLSLTGSGLSALANTPKGQETINYLYNLKPVQIFVKARQAGLKGENLIGESAKRKAEQEAVDTSMKSVNQIQNSIDSKGEAYAGVNAQNAGEKMSIQDFSDDLENQLKEINAPNTEEIMSPVKTITEGKFVDKPGFEPGKVNTQDVVKGFSPKETVPSAQENLEGEASKIIEGNKQLGKTTEASYSPSEDNSFLTRILRTQEPEGPTAIAKTVENTPSYTKIQPNTEEQPFSQDIKPVTNTVREGGDPDATYEQLRGLRKILYKMSNKPNLSPMEQDILIKKNQQLSQMMKDRFPGLEEADQGFQAAQELISEGGPGTSKWTKMNDFVKASIPESATDTVKSNQFNELMSKVEAYDPDLANKIRTQVKSAGDKYNLVKNVNTVNPLELARSPGRALTTSTGMTGNLSGLASKQLNPYGGAANLVKRGAMFSEVSGDQPQLEKSSKLYSASDDELRQYGQKLLQNNYSKAIGESLVKAINDKDIQAKNNAIFVILQKNFSEE